MIDGWIVISGNHRAIFLRDIRPVARKAADITNTAITFEQFVQCDVGVVISADHSLDALVILYPIVPSCLAFLRAVYLAVIASRSHAELLPAVLTNVNCQPPGQLIIDLAA